MSVEIGRYNQQNGDAIQRAVMGEWSFDDFYSMKHNTLWSTGEDNITGGESEYDFAKRIAEAVWKANGDTCPVSLEATRIDDAPTNIYVFDGERESERSEE